eukprot:TRINITY_DN911_c0_g1_i1.p1 TRINITY_DN911_c0_g1~~TRINITY_DN911_c0_g1_i1.p1  ORF type:complete len:463 (+),score=110.18 TRINITY_DN911_c0_g1_i1:53-1390(+)
MSAAAPKKILKQRYLSPERTASLPIDIKRDDDDFHVKEIKRFESLEDIPIESSPPSSSMALPPLLRVAIGTDTNSSDDDLWPSSDPTSTRKGRFASSPAVLKRVEFSPVNEVKLIYKTSSRTPPPMSRIAKKLAKQSSSKKDTANMFEASPRSPTRPALKSRWNNNQRELERYSKLKLEDQARIELLKRGAVLNKWSNGKAETRFFWVNEDGSELRWAKPSFKSQKLEADLAAGNVSTSKITSYKKLELGDVSFLVFGPRTKRFIGYDWLRSHPEDCFSVILPDGETMDIECANRQEFMNWYLGVRSLAPLSRKTYDRAQINWHRALYRTMQFARNNDVDVLDVWHELVALSKQGNDVSLSELQLNIVLTFNGEAVLVDRKGSGVSSKRRNQQFVIQTRREMRKPALKYSVVDADILASSSPISRSNIGALDGVMRLSLELNDEE